MSAYPHLFSPLRIGNVTVRNRIMQTAHVKLFAEAAVDSQRNVDYQAARARGGAGLLITGNRVVHPTSTTGFPRVAWQYLPEALEADRRLTDAVHEHGAVIFAQLNHFGLNATSDSADDLRVLWGPSAVKSPAYGETPKAMEPEDIAEVVEWWARSAELSPRGRLRRHRGAHLAQLPAAPVPLAALQQADRRVRRLVREPAAVRARGDRRRSCAGRRRLGRRRPDQPQRLHPRRARRRGRDPRRADARGRRARSTTSTSPPPATTTSSCAIQPSDEPDGYLVDLTAQVKAAVGGCPCSPSAGSRTRRSPRRSSPRARPTWSR